jgi:hypothetical protein
MVQPSKMAQILKLALVFAGCTVLILKGALTNLACHFFASLTSQKNSGVLV